MKAFIDTNIVIDFFDKRPNFYDAAAQVMASAYRGEIDVLISATSVINSFYILRKAYDIESLKQAFIKIFDFCHIVGVTKESVINGLNSKCKDFEDAVQISAAQESHADCIITRDVKHFAESPLPVYDPITFLNNISN